MKKVSYRTISLVLLAAVTVALTSCSWGKKEDEGLKLRNQNFSGTLAPSVQSKDNKF